MAFMWHLVSIFFLMITRGELCTEYGCPGRPQSYELFVPAPPGRTPHCALPGQTFCETPDHYPRHLIKFLIDQCNFNFNTALQDESFDDFNSYSSLPDYKGYNYPQVNIPLYMQTLSRKQPALVYGPPSNSSRSYKYSIRVQRNPFLSEVPRKYHRDVQRQIDQAYSQESLNLFGPNQSLMNRYSRNDKIPRSYNVNPLLNYARGKSDRIKRQSDPDIIRLCPVRSQYIMPRAALNKEGNWMFLVNLPGNDKYTQLVKAEICIRDVCDGICSFPEGYRTRCQQQFVQKRLVALEGSGNSLYTDLFWFPHGCICEIKQDF